MATTWGACGLVLLSLTGCGGDDTYFADDVDTSFEIFDFGDADDELHMPYVAGTRFRVSAHVRGEAETGSQWTFVSTNEDVLVVEAQLGNGADCLAVGSGVAELIANPQNGPGEQHSAQITVKAPNRFDVVPNAWMRTFEAGVPSDEPKIVLGGEGTLLVRYYEDNLRLFGNGIISTDSAIASPDTSSLPENKEWLRVVPDAAGPHDIQLSTVNGPLGTLTVHGVPEEDITRVSVFGSDEEDREQGETLRVLAAGRTADDDMVLGVGFEWSLSGGSAVGSGDILEYNYNEDNRAEVSATGAGLSNSIVVHGDGFATDDSTNIGCSAAPGRAGGGWAAGLLVALGAALARRRRGGAAVTQAR